MRHCSMELQRGEQSSAVVGRRRGCGYRYMMPSYAVDEEHDPATSYRVVVDALLENSSAHGLPTLYRARGLYRLLMSIISAFKYYLNNSKSFYYFNIT